MFWIVHLFALLLFWPALFVTVPLHIISSKMAPREKAQEPPKAFPAKQQSEAPEWLAMLVLSVVLAAIWFYIF